MTKKTPPIWAWFNTPAYQRHPLTWIRYRNGRGLVPSHMAKVVQEHNDFCDKRDTFFAQCLAFIGIILPVALVVLILVLTLK